MINAHTPFRYNASVYGGTEYMARTFLELIYPKLKKLNEYLCLVLPGAMLPLSQIVDDKRKVILWVHNTPTQFTPMLYNMLRNPVFIDKLEYIIVPSVAAKDMYMRDIPEIYANKIYVINNAIVLNKYNKNKFKAVDKVNAIHTSDPSRGMLTLINSMSKVKGDIRVNIFNDFNPDLNPDLKADKRIKFYNRTPRAIVKEAMEDSHICAYPSNFEETFCLSIVEAMSAGALPIYPNIGSLAEVTNGFGIQYDFKLDPEEHSNIFAEKFNEAIDLVKSNKWNPEEQIKYVNNTFSWDAIEVQWKNFEEQL